MRRFQPKEYFNFIIKRIKNAVKLITGEKLYDAEREKVHVGKISREVL